MLVLQLRGEGQAASVYDGSVVAVIADDVVTTSHQLGDDTFVYGKTCGEAERFVFSHEFSQFLFQLHVDVECAVQQTGTGTACAIFVGSCLGCINDAFVIRQAHIGIRTEHQDLLAIHQYLCILVAVDFTEIRIYAFGHKLLRQVVFRKFFL